MSWVIYVCCISIIFSGPLTPITRKIQRTQSWLFIRIHIFTLISHLSSHFIDVYDSELLLNFILRSRKENNKAPHPLLISYKRFSYILLPLNTGLTAKRLIRLHPCYLNQWRGVGNIILHLPIKIKEIKEAEADHSASRVPLFWGYQRSNTLWRMGTNFSVEIHCHFVLCDYGF